MKATCFSEIEVAKERFNEYTQEIVKRISVWFEKDMDAIKDKIEMELNELEYELDRERGRHQDQAKRAFHFQHSWEPNGPQELEYEGTANVRPYGREKRARSTGPSFREFFPTNGLESMKSNIRLDSDDGIVTLNYNLDDHIVDLEETSLTKSHSVHRFSGYPDPKETDFVDVKSTINSEISRNITNLNKLIGEDVSSETRSTEKVCDAKRLEDQEEEFYRETEDFDYFDRSPDKYTLPNVLQSITKARKDVELSLIMK